MNMAQDDFDIMDVPPAPGPTDYFSDCEDPATRAVELLRMFFYGLPETVKAQAYYFEGASIVQHLLLIEGFGDWDMDKAVRILRLEHRLDLSEYRPDITPSSWTAKNVEKELRLWTVNEVKVEASRTNKWCDWTANVTLAGRTFTAWNKTRKGALQEVVARNDLAEHIAKTYLATSGWTTPTDDYLRSFQTPAGKARLEARSAAYDAAKVVHAAKVAEAKEARREVAQAFVDQSTLMASRLEGVNIRSLRDIKKALPEGWRAETARDSRGICYLVYSGRFSWAASAYLATGAGEALYRTLRWHSRQTAEDYLSDMDNWRRSVPFGYPNMPQRGPASPQDMVMP